MSLIWWLAALAVWIAYVTACALYVGSIAEKEWTIRTPTDVDQRIKRRIMELRQDLGE